MIKNSFYFLTNLRNSKTWAQLSGVTVKDAAAKYGYVNGKSCWKTESVGNYVAPGIVT